MLKIISVSDKQDSAIDRLARGMEPYNGNFDYEVIPTHPKRPEAKDLEYFEQRAKDAHLIDFGYFRTAYMLMERFPWLKDKKKILQHHNPYSITENKWTEFDYLTVNNQTIYSELSKLTQVPIELIGNTVDTDFWTFKRDWTPKNQVIMVANRIESKKGILPVAQACQSLGLKMVLVGSVSDMDYFKSVLKTGVVEFRQQITDEELREAYWQSKLHVCNSVDNFESGTNPILEAMLCGTPVMTRSVGHVPDLDNGENFIINESKEDDVENLTKLIRQALKSDLEPMRQKAWDTAKTRSHERRAYLYQKLYRKVLFPDSKPVSVITPIYKKPELTLQTVGAISKQDYKNIELILIRDDDGEDPIKLPDCDFPVRIIRNYQNDYGLARARNRGAIEATGDILVFCDQRIVMEPDAISILVQNLAPKRWVYGNKGKKKGFVENFSAISRGDFIRGGMCNERIDEYGGMSQELRSRFKYQGFTTEFVETAKAKQIGTSKNKYAKRQEIIKMKNKLFKMGLEL